MLSAHDSHYSLVLPSLRANGSLICQKVFFYLLYDCILDAHYYTRNIIITPLQIRPLTYALRNRNQWHIPDLIRTMLKAHMYVIFMGTMMETSDTLLVSSKSC